LGEASGLLNLTGFLPNDAPAPSDLKTNARLKQWRAFALLKGLWLLIVGC